MYSLCIKKIIRKTDIKDKNINKTEKFFITEKPIAFPVNKFSCTEPEEDEEKKVREAIKILSETASNMPFNMF